MVSTRQMPVHDFTALLKDRARKIRLPAFQKHHRGPKKPIPKRKAN